MSPPPSKRWLHPQAVPRGFLRLYILTALSRGPESGYSIIQKIDERTDGAWRPGAGTMYPLLKSLSRGGLVKPARERVEGGGKAYALTPKGRRALEEMRRTIGGVGRKEGAMGRLFSDILPGELFVRFVIRRMREGEGIFREKLNELPGAERTAVLRELRDILGGQLVWVEGALSNEARREPKPPARGSPPNL
jgi:DNA-binding PadR family transcriptional regulator